MVSRAAVRVTINVGGKPQRLLSMNENKKGDVFLSLKSGEYVRGPVSNYPPGFVFPPQAQKVLESRVTVHPLREGHSLAVVQHHLRWGSGEAWKERKYTSATVETDCYDLILTKRYMDHRVERSDDFLSDYQNVSLGDYDPSRFSVFVAYYITNPKSASIAGCGRDFTVLEYDFREVRVVIIWSFMPVASFTSFTNRMFSKNHNIGFIKPSDMVQPLSNVAMLASFQALRHEAWENLRDQYQALTPPLSIILPKTGDLPRHFRQGFGGTTEFLGHMAEVLARTGDIQIVVSDHAIT